MRDMAQTQKIYRTGDWICRELTDRISLLGSRLQIIATWDMSDKKLKTEIDGIEVLLKEAEYQIKEIKEGLKDEAV